MRRMRVLGALAVVLLAVSGCAGVPGVPAPRPDATPVAAITCMGMFEEAAEPGPVAGAVPDDFDPVALYRCDPNATDEDDAGVWAGARVERFEGDLARVLDALATPNDPRWGGACSAVGYAGPEYWVADAGEQYVRVSLPADGCSLPKADALAAVQAGISRLRLVEETFTPSTLVESRAATSAGCSTQAGVLVLADLSDSALSDSGLVDSGLVTEDEVVQPEEGNVIPWEPPELPDPADVDGMLVCLYETTDASAEALFVRSAQLAADDARAAVTDAAAARPSGPCRDTATRIVVAHPLADGASDATSFTVELDGCRRLIDPALRAMAAPPALLALLAAAAS